MKKLTSSVLAVVLTSSFAMVNAQAKRDTATKTKDIGEVVITGAMGIKKKADAVTSTQQVVTAEKLTQAGTQNIAQALTGKVSGLQINQTNSGAVDSNSIVLRGTRSITGNNEALVVIDNVISSASVLQQLPPEVIESVNVIKGAQGAALYGSDGVNGAIIVTTKTGTKAARVNVSLNSTVDFETPAYIPKRQRRYGQGWDGTKINVENGAWGPSFSDPKLAGTMVPYGIPWYDYNNDGVLDVNPNDFSATPDDPAALHSPFAPYGNKDNVRSFFKTGSIFANDLTINAGGDGKYALLSIGHTRRDFVVMDDRSDKTSILFKGGATLNRWTLDGTVNYIRRASNTTDAGLYYDLLQSSQDIPFDKFQNLDAAYAWNIYYRNPYWVIKNNRFKNTSNYFNVTAGVGYKINDHISAKYTANIQNTSSENFNFQNAWNDTRLGNSAKAIASWLYKDQSNRLNYYGDLLVNFDYDINDDINVKLNVGSNYQDRNFNITSAGGDILSIPKLYTISNIQKPYLPKNIPNGRYRRNSVAGFANLDVSYKDFLFLNATGRNEWTSVLSKDNNSYFYPSVGVSFVPTKAFEGLKSDVLNYMKISGSWTRVGNSTAVDWYKINRIMRVGAGFPYSSTGPTGGGLSVVENTTPADPNIRPEFVTSKELSLDLGFLKDRITLNGSIYQQDTKDLITNQSSSRASGIVTDLINIGAMRTRGAEVNLGIVPVKSRDVQWDVNFSYSTSQSKVLKVTDDTDEVALMESSMVGIYAKKGSLFPLIKANAYERDDQGRIIIDYATGNPLYTSTLKEFGSSTPKYILGLNTSLKIKGFKLGAVMDYRTGNVFYSATAEGFTFNGGLVESANFDREKGGFIMPNSVYKDPATGQYVANTSVKTGGNDYQGVSTYYSSIHNRIGENFIVDGSALKIREISLSYTVPRSVLYNTGLSEITLGVHARNPFTKLAKNNLNYNDPETSSTLYATDAFNPNIAPVTNALGYASTDQYPSLKAYGVTLNIKF